LSCAYIQDRQWAYQQGNKNWPRAKMTWQRSVTHVFMCEGRERRATWHNAFVYTVCRNPAQPDYAAIMLLLKQFMLKKRHVLRCCKVMRPLDTERY
jgi:hypothetical protein